MSLSGFISSAYLTVKKSEVPQTLVRMLVTKLPSNEQAMLDNERNLDLREWMLNQKEEEEEREGLKEEQERKEKREDGRVAATGNCK